MNSPANLPSSYSAVSLAVDYLLIGEGGGGAGAYATGSTVLVSSGYPVVIGGGGGEEQLQTGVILHLMELQLMAAEKVIVMDLMEDRTVMDLEEEVGSNEL